MPSYRWPAGHVGAGYNDHVAEIARCHQKFNFEWRNLHGWAPPEAAQMLADARLDWLASLAECLKLFSPPQKDGDFGRLILAWTTLGSLLEGSMKFFLAVYYEDFKNTFSGAIPAPAIRSSKLWDRKAGRPNTPEAAQLNDLKEFFKLHVWELDAAECERLMEFVGIVQQRRNAIHAFKTRELGNWPEFECATKQYAEFISDKIAGSLPDLPSDQGHQP